VELKSPSDWTICGAACGAAVSEVGFNMAAGALSGWELVGIVTWIGFTGFGGKSLLLSLWSVHTAGEGLAVLSGELREPAAELLCGICGTKNGGRNSDTISASFEDCGSSLQGNSGGGDQLGGWPGQGAKAADAFNADGHGGGLLGGGWEYGAESDVIRTAGSCELQLGLVTGGRAEDCLPTHQFSRNVYRQVACIYVNAMEAGRKSYIDAVIENQHCLGERCAQDERICQNLGIGSGLISILEQGQAGGSQFPAQLVQKCSSILFGNAGGIEDWIDARQLKSHS
jgi:hypothetical protein